MVSHDQKHEVGSILLLERGDYSSRVWEGPFRVVKTFKRSEIVNKFITEWKPENIHSWQSEDDKPEPEDFIAWLSREGYIEDIKHASSWHVGSYGEFSP